MKILKRRILRSLQAPALVAGTGLLLHQASAAGWPGGCQ